MSKKCLTEDECQHEEGLTPFKGMLNGLLAVIFMYSGAFFLIKWLKRVL